MLAIRRLGGRARQGRAGRAHHRAACRSTAPSSASRRTRPTRSSARPRRARRELLNKKEEFSYRYSRLKSYSQYLLFDDPPRPRLLGAAVGRLPDRPAVPRRRGEAGATRRTSCPIVVKRAAAACYDLGPRAARARAPATCSSSGAAGSFVNDGAEIARTSAATSRSSAGKRAQLPLQATSAESPAR